MLITSARSTLAFLQATTAPALLAIPAQYIGGKMMVIRALVGDIDLVLVPPKSSLPTLSARFGLTALTPMQAQQSLGELRWFSTILIGGGAVSATLEAALQRVPAAVYHTYGMTETASHVALRALNGPHRAETFNALPGITFGVDERQCLNIVAPGWGIQHLQTNDIVKLYNPEAFVWLGRVDNVVNSGGVKLHPEQIEQVLASRIAGAFFVAGLPDDVLGEKLVLVAEGEPKPLIFTDLPRIEQPREVFWLPEFVRTATQKINRVATLAMAVEQGST
jgi:O-succinylbenzoic acid--CoA ligase